MPLATGSKRISTTPPQHWPIEDPSGKLRSASFSSASMPTATRVLWYSSCPPPIVPMVSLAVTIIFAPISRGAEPRIPATVTRTTGSPAALKSLSSSIHSFIGDTLQGSQNCLGRGRGMQVRQDPSVAGNCIPQRQECRQSQHQRRLTDRLGTVDGLFTIRGVLQQFDPEVRGQIRAGRYLVRRRCVCAEVTLLVPPELLRRQPADALHVAAFDLAEIDGWVQRITAIVQDVRAQ